MLGIWKPRVIGGNWRGRIAVAAAGLGCLVGGQAAGQQDPPDAPGMWIRFSTRPMESDPAWSVARVIDVTDAFLVVEPLGEGALAVDRGIVTRVERSEGWRNRQARGGAIGAVLGAAVGVGLFLGTDCANCVALTGLGFGVGWWAGARDRQVEWLMIPLERVDIMLRPRRIAGVGVRLGIGPW